MEFNVSHVSTDTNSVSLSLQPEPSHSPPNKKRKIADILSNCFVENKQLKKQKKSLENDMITMGKTHNKLLLQNKLLIKQNNDWREIFNKIINTINEDNTIKNKFSPLQLNNIPKININLNVNTTNKSMHKSHQITNNMNTNNMNDTNIVNTNINTNINNTNNTNKNMYNYSGSDMELENDNDMDMDYMNIKSNGNVKEELNILHERRIQFEDKIFIKKEFESNDNRNRNKKTKRKIKKRKKKKCNDVSDDNSKDIVYNTDRPRTRNTRKMRHEHFKKAQEEYNKLEKDTILNGDNKQVDIVLLE